MPDIHAIDPDLVAIQDAAVEFGVSVTFLYEHSYDDPHNRTSERALRRITVRGDRRTFLRRSEVRAYFLPSDYDDKRPRA